MEEGRDGVEAVAQLSNFISEFYFVHRRGGGKERLWRIKFLKNSKFALIHIYTRSN